MTATSATIEVYCNETWTGSFLFTGREMDGAKLVFHAVHDGAEVFRKTSGSGGGITIPDASNKTAYLTFGAADTALLQAGAVTAFQFWWSLGGEIDVVFEGKINCLGIRVPPTPFP